MLEAFIRLFIGTSIILGLVLAVIVTGHVIEKLQIINTGNTFVSGALFLGMTSLCALAAFAVGSFFRE